MLAQDSHICMRKSLDVLALSTTPPKEEYECNKLLIKNIPETVNEDVLVMFLEGILEFEHQADFVVKLKNARATVNFTREYSAEGIHIVTRIY